MKFRRYRLLFLSLGIVFSLFPGNMLLAQSTGSIRGTVSDTTGANIVDATVTATNPSTGLTRTQQTNGDGIFVFPDLPIGSYTLQIAKHGFQTQQREALELLTGQNIALDIKLTVGIQTVSVEVDTDTQQIQTATSEVATTVDQKQMQDLPLNGRNPLQLTALTPGAVLTNTGTESGQQDNTGLSVNGLRATQNNYQLDGSIYVDRFFDSVPILPNPDALQEFTIQAANFSAEFAGAGAVVQLSTRSGTNQLHGSAFEFFRNTVLNAKNYFQSTIPPYKLNQFGGTVGAPIVIPHIYNGKDKTFFFFAAEDMQQRSSPNPISINVPTAAELKGDFSGQSKTIYNPSTGLPYSGNIITTPESPLSAAVAKEYIDPVLANPNTNQQTGNFKSSSNSNVDRTQYLVKVDHAVHANNHLSGRYFYVQDNFQRAFNAPLGFFAENLFRNQSLTLSDTQIFSNTLTGTIYATGSRYARTQIPETPTLHTLQDLGQNLPLGTTVPIFAGVRANISGFVDLFSGGALTQDSTTFEYKAQLVKVLGAHTISFGGGYERTRIDADDFSYTPGDHTFNGSRTQNAAGQGGSAAADFYLGLGSTFFQDNGRKFYLRENRPAIYIQDDWKVTRALTVNAGVRWDPWLPPIDLNESLVGFKAGQQSTVAPGAPVGMVFNGDAGTVPSVFHNNYKAFGPRLGFAYNVAGQGRTVVRGAYGIFYGFPEGLLYQRTDAAQPIDLYLNIPAPPAWDNIYAGFPGGDPFPRAHVPPSQFKTYSFILPVSGGLLNPASKVAYNQNYNLTVEQQLPGNMAMSLAYVGNHAVHIMASRQFNPAVYGPGATIGNENSRRLYPGLGAMELADAYSYELYNSLQLNVTRRVSRDLTLLGNLVWARVTDNTSSGTEGQAGPPNPYNLNSSRGPADFDQAVRVNISANYYLPKFTSSRHWGELANGWQLNMIANLRTGMPYTVTSGTDRSLSGIGNDYADIVPGVSTNRTAGFSRIAEYFNPAAFNPAAIGTFGNTHRNVYRGPGYEDIDASIFKDFFTERRVHGQFRAEGFNILNHTNLNNPVTTVSSKNSVIGTPNSLGTINGSGDPRVFQFGAKILF
ncbi:hypothetical protein GCM10011507_27460 [Edaphobacter acidisoli]|uniref:TonB-dependent transporter Oar-like beta-barrel domain-containing protein n=1 Tax=Edaphobacter acidisoli TaxID=2040573 RepID=A0A916W7A7_9BACT|nr:carboxypeptidase-like regulatory domain-containing protein [Edaphobacter acidisoli]GGA74548.1 hypothetical protein GCM10011507_27460 [Edaphobacter acidisoli]